MALGKVFTPPPGQTVWPHASQWTRNEWAHWCGQTGMTTTAFRTYWQARDQCGLRIQRQEKRQAAQDVWLYRPTPRQVVFHQAPAVNVLYGGAYGGAKALGLETRLPTPQGYTTVGQIAIGDTLFDERGDPCHVLWTSPAVIDPTGTYALTFDDGTVIVAGGGHEWLTLTLAERQMAIRRSVAARAARRATRQARGVGTRPDLSARNRQQAVGYLSSPVEGQVRTTAQLVASVANPRGATQHAVRLAEAWQMPAVDLPIDPYVLGVWLGDGTAAGGSITTADLEILYACEHAGHAIRSYGHYHYGLSKLTTPLRQLGLLKNKHVPALYLHASRDQRLALLQGLMDSDGTCAHDGQSSFTNTNVRLSDAVFYLAVSLGLKPTRASQAAMLKGKRCGTAYQVRWTATLRVFRLPRKADRLKQTGRSTQQYRYLVSACQIDDQLVQCLEVDSPSHLFLAGDAGIPTHNSEALRWDAHRRALWQPNHRAILFRRTLMELKDNHIDKARQEAETFGGTFIEGDKTLRYPNGSWLRFAHCENLGDEEKYLSSEYEWIGLDELATFTRTQALAIISRARTSTAGVTAVVRCSSNPAGAHTQWCVDRFIDHQIDLEDDPAYDPAEWQFVGAKLYDNPYLMDPDGSFTRAERRLSPFSPERRRQMLDGDWTAIGGQFFPEFRRDRHIADRDGETTGVWWECWIDWGYNAPGVCYWVACLPDGRLYVRHEYKFTQTIAADVAQAITKQTALLAQTLGHRVQMRKRVADPSMWNHTGHTGESIADTFARYGVVLQKGDNERELGWQRFRHFLATAPDGAPWIQWHPSCTYAIRSIPSIVCDPQHPDDADTDGDDHAIDASRYGCMGRPAPSTAASTPRAQDGSLAWLRQRFRQKPGLLRPTHAS